jgi:hypothetical protein
MREVVQWIALEVLGRLRQRFAWGNGPFLSTYSIVLVRYDVQCPHRWMSLGLDASQLYRPARGIDT